MIRFRQLCGAFATLVLCRGVADRACAGHAQGGRRPARQLGHDDRRSRPARRHLQEARAHPRDPVDARRRRNAAGGDLGQRRHRRRAGHHGRAVGVFQRSARCAIIGAETTGASDLYWYVPSSSPIKTLKDTDGQDDRLFDQRLVHARDRHRVHEAVRPQGEADGDRRTGADADAGDVGADRRRLVRAAVRPAAARRRQDPRSSRAATTRRSSRARRCAC